MKISARILLVCLLMLAGPVQAYAAATMAFCGMRQQGGASPSESASSVAPHGSKANAYHHGEHQLHQTANSGHGHANCDDPFSGSTCSACAACCHGASIVGALVVLSVQSAGSSLIALPLACALGYITEVPERPPRFARS